MSSLDALEAGAEALGLTLDAGQLRQLLRHLQLIEKWNRVYNLTAIRDVNSMVPHHVLDSLTIVPRSGGESLIDIGSGPGLPGLPVAIAQPSREVVLLEANHKKVAFLRQATIEIGLRNVRIVHSRAETYRERTFKVVVTRAFAELSAFIATAGHLAAEGGVLLAMKGVYPFEELTKMPPGWIVRSSAAVHVPGLDAERHVLELVRT